MTAAKRLSGRLYSGAINVDGTKSFEDQPGRMLLTPLSGDEARSKVSEELLEAIRPYSK